MKTIYKLLLSTTLLLFVGSCADFLEREPDNIVTVEGVFSDPNMINSVLANFYDRIDWGQRISDSNQYIYLDEACNSNGGPDQTRDYGDDKWRVYDYRLIRNLNQFLEGVRSDAAAGLDPNYRKQIEAEARFIRAWTYFNMARCLGGVTIVDDKVFDYSTGMDLTPLQIPRSTEAATYDYVINECTEIAKMLPDDPSKNVHAARGNKWGALALKARATIYAASLAKYNNLLPNPIRTSGGEVGISAEKAAGYYELALSTCQEIIMGGKYSLYNLNPNKGRNFYEAIAVKEGNPEVIWALDYQYPGKKHGFTTGNMPVSVREDVEATHMTPILNLVEAFEYIDNRDGTLHEKNGNGEYIYYDKATDIFKNKDARLYGTVIYPGADYRAQEIVFQAGRKSWENGQWIAEIGDPGATDANGDLISSINGPNLTNNENQNKVGFCVRKFIDEAKGSGTRGRGSEIWFVRMRYAEVLMIAAEAAMELGNQSTALEYINQIRYRAGIQPLATLTLDDIIRERRVEFAFENHRWWDLKRFRKAHLIWNGVNDNPAATQYVLFPYRVNNPGQPNHGKWIFDKQKAHMAPYPRNFQMKNYYNFYDSGWLNENPNLIKNPYQ